MVIPAHAGIQEVPEIWIPAYAGMTFHRDIHYTSRQIAERSTCITRSSELQRPRTPASVRQWVASPPAWFAVQPPQQPLPAQQFPQLGLGSAKPFR
jgi:hypothetical protein